MADGFKQRISVNRKIKKYSNNKKVFPRRLSRNRSSRNRFIIRRCAQRHVVKDNFVLFLISKLSFFVVDL
jgi:hypothetical protein